MAKGAIVTRAEDFPRWYQDVIAGAEMADNGPGEAREADLGIAAGKQKGHLFIRGKIIRVVPESDMVQALVAEAERLVDEGVEARMAAADTGAEAEAEADRRALLDSSGADPNHTAEKIEIIRRHADK